MAAQLPDHIVIDGISQELYTNPLEQYWLLQKIKRPSFITTSICKRGYIAYWEIIDQNLILKGVDGKFVRRYFLFWKKIVTYSIRNLFRKLSDKGIIAKWYSGKIRIPLGNRILYVHHGYESRFEREMILTIDHGKVVKSLVLDYTHETLQVEPCDLFPV